VLDNSQPAREPQVRGYRAPALEKGLDILELLAGEPQGLSQNQIGRKLGRSVSEIFRMLTALERRGYILRKRPDDVYRLTMRLFELAHRHPPTERLLAEALPVMHHLAERVEAACHLAVYHDRRLLIIARVESPAPVGYAVRLGAQFPLANRASGRVLLAFQPSEIRQRWLKDMAETEAGPVDPGLLSRRLDAIRARGFERSASDTVPGVTDFSSPILDRTGFAIAALTVPYLALRGSRPDFRAISADVADAANRISELLGGGAVTAPGRSGDDVPG
jgi:DNA-binding IclR family transcriptional regulator